MVKNEILQPLVVELATKLNKLVNIPWVDEQQEQAFFEMIIQLVLETLLTQFSRESLERAVKGK